MKIHTTSGRDMLEHATESVGAFSYLAIAIQMAWAHHEWWNGKGYSEQLKGEGIPLCARIMAVADVLVCSGYSEPIKVQLYPEVYITDSDYTAEDFSQDYDYMIDDSKTMGYKEFATKSGKEYSILLIPHNNINVRQHRTKTA